MKPAIASVKKYIDIDLDGTVHEMPYSLGLESDLRIMWAKDFWEKWCEAVFEKPFEKIFKDDEFCGQDDRAEYATGDFRSKVVYKILMKDGSSLYASYDIDSNYGHVDLDGNDSETGTLAADFIKHNGKYEWNTDTLDAFVKE